MKATIKQVLINTSLGRIGARLRSFSERLRSPVPVLDTVANDQLAVELLPRLCTDARTYVDVGAHIGFLISEVVRSNPDIAVVAFEAVPHKAEFLRRKFPAVEVYACAVGEENCETTFFVNVNRDGYSSLARSAEASHAIQIPMVSLDGAISHHKIDVLKIDVEGAELGVLKGGAVTIHRDRPVIMFESGPELILGYTKDAIFTWFAGAAYELYVPNRLGHGGAPLSREAFLDAHEYPRRTTNYFAIPAEQRAEVWDRIRVRPNG